MKANMKLCGDRLDQGILELVPETEEEKNLVHYLSNHRTELIPGARWNNTGIDPLTAFTNYQFVVHLPFPFPNK